MVMEVLERSGAEVEGIESVVWGDEGLHAEELLLI